MSGGSPKYLVIDLENPANCEKFPKILSAMSTCHASFVLYNNDEHLLESLSPRISSSTPSIASKSGIPSPIQLALAQSPNLLTEPISSSRGKIESANEQRSIASTTAAVGLPQPVQVAEPQKGTSSIPVAMDNNQQHSTVQHCQLGIPIEPVTHSQTINNSFETTHQRPAELENSNGGEGQDQVSRRRTSSLNHKERNYSGTGSNPQAGEVETGLIAHTQQAPPQSSFSAARPPASNTAENNRLEMNAPFPIESSPTNRQYNLGLRNNVSVSSTVEPVYPSSLRAAPVVTPHFNEHRINSQLIAAQQTTSDASSLALPITHESSLRHATPGIRDLEGNQPSVQQHKPHAKRSQSSSQKEVIQPSHTGIQALPDTTTDISNSRKRTIPSETDIAQGLPVITITPEQIHVGSNPRNAAPAETSAFQPVKKPTSATSASCATSSNPAFSQQQNLTVPPPIVMPSQPRGIPTVHPSNIGGQGQFVNTPPQSNQSHQADPRLRGLEAEEQRRMQQHHQMAQEQMMRADPNFLAHQQHMQRLIAQHPDHPEVRAMMAAMQRGPIPAQMRMHGVPGTQIQFHPHAFPVNFIPTANKGQPFPMNHPQASVGAQHQPHPQQMIIHNGQMYPYLLKGHPVNPNDPRIRTVMPPMAPGVHPMHQRPDVPPAAPPANAPQPRQSNPNKQISSEELAQQQVEEDRRFHEEMKRVKNKQSHPSGRAIPPNGPSPTHIPPQEARTPREADLNQQNLQRRSGSLEINELPLAGMSNPSLPSHGSGAQQSSYAQRLLEPQHGNNPTTAQNPGSELFASSGLNNIVREHHLHSDIGRGAAAPTSEAAMRKNKERQSISTSNFAVHNQNRVDNPPQIPPNNRPHDLALQAHYHDPLVDQMQLREAQASGQVPTPMHPFLRVEQSKNSKDVQFPPQDFQVVDRRAEQDPEARRQHANQYDRLDRPAIPHHRTPHLERTDRDLQVQVDPKMIPGQPHRVMHMVGLDQQQPMIMKMQNQYEMPQTQKVMPMTHEEMQKNMNGRPEQVQDVGGKQSDYNPVNADVSENDERNRVDGELADHALLSEDNGSFRQQRQEDHQADYEQNHSNTSSQQQLVEKPNETTPTEQNETVSLGRSVDMNANSQDSMPLSTEQEEKKRFLEEEARQIEMEKKESMNKKQRYKDIKDQSHPSQKDGMLPSYISDYQKQGVSDSQHRLRNSQEKKQEHQFQFPDKDLAEKQQIETEKERQSIAEKHREVMRKLADSNDDFSAMVPKPDEQNIDNDQGCSLSTSSVAASTEENQQSIPAEVPKKGRGRPRKTTATAFKTNDAITITDSEDDDHGSNRGRNQRYLKSLIGSSDNRRSMTNDTTNDCSRDSSSTEPELKRVKLEKEGILGGDDYIDSMNEAVRRAQILRDEIILQKNYNVNPNPDDDELEHILGELQSINTVEEVKRYFNKRNIESRVSKRGFQKKVPQGKSRTTRTK